MRQEKWTNCIYSGHQPIFGCHTRIVHVDFSTLRNLDSLLRLDEMRLNLVMLVRHRRLKTHPKRLTRLYYCQSYELMRMHTIASFLTDDAHTTTSDSSQTLPTPIVYVTLQSSRN